MSEFRLQRVENMLRDMVSEMIMRGTVKDPRISKLVSISRVEVSNDLSFAKIFMSGFENEKKIRSSVEALNHASGFIQSKLGKKMHTRTTPKLRFIFDDSIKEGFEMTRKLDSLEISPEEPEDEVD